MKLHLKFQITRFMLAILLLILVILPTLLKAEQVKKNNGIELPEKALGKEIKISTNIAAKKNNNTENIPYYMLKQGETKLVIISNLGLNHLRTNIKSPNIYTASDVSIKIDGYNIYIDAKNKVKPIDLFIEAENGNVYSLTLIPKQVPPQSLYFKAVDYTPNMKKYEINKDKSNNIPFWLNKRDYYYIDDLKNIIRKMALNKEIQGFFKEDNLNVKTTIDDLASKLISRYTGSNLMGEVWKITNIGSIPVKISPKDFYYKNVLAVAIELKKSMLERQLNPNESCYVYIIKTIN